MSDKPENRYDIRKDEDDEWWTVYDIFTGDPARANGVYLTHCERDEADDLVDLLNVRYIVRRGGTTHYCPKPPAEGTVEPLPRNTVK